MATVAIATVAIMASPVLSYVKIRDTLGGRSNNREVLGVNRQLLDNSEAQVNLRVTFIG